MGTVKAQNFHLLPTGFLHSADLKFSLLDEKANNLPNSSFKIESTPPLNLSRSTDRNSPCMNVSLTRDGPETEVTHLFDVFPKMFT